MVILVHNERRQISFVVETSETQNKAIRPGKKQVNGSNASIAKRYSCIKKLLPQGQLLLF